MNHLLGTETIGGVHIEWAAAPPTKFSIVLSNSSTLLAGQRTTTVYEDNHVAISAPYDPEAFGRAEIRAYNGNVTDVKLDESVPVAGSRFAVLTVFGSANDTVEMGVGASVGEFALLSA